MAIRPRWPALRQPFAVSGGIPTAEQRRLPSPHNGRQVKLSLTGELSRRTTCAKFLRTTGSITCVATGFPPNRGSDE
jgi:hypothetical protein